MRAVRIAWLLGIVFLAAPNAMAATLHVTSLADDGPGSLREAIAFANARPAQTHSIVLTALEGTVELVSAPLRIEVDMDLIGPGADRLAISAGGRFSVFHVVNYSGHVLFRDLTIRDGFTDGFYGGGIYVQAGEVEVRRCTVTNNEALWSGGGMLNSFAGRLIVRESRVCGNRAGRGGGGVSGSRLSRAYVTRSEICDNEAGKGGGAYDALIVDSFVRNNQAELCGGVAESTLYNTVVTGNVGSVSGVCVGVGDHIVNSTITGNHDPGGGFNHGAVATGRLSPPFLFQSNKLWNSIVARNTGGDVDISVFSNNLPQIEIRNSLVGDGTLSGLTDGVDGNIVGTAEAPVDPLFLGGGSFELSPSSPAIDAGKDSLTPPELTTDLAGGPRFVGARVDMGAYEWEAPLLATFDSMSATAVGKTIEIRWTTALETDTAGFRVLREAGRREKTLEVIAQLAALGDALSGRSYIVTDLVADPDDAVRYYIEEVDVYGKTTRHGPITVDRGQRRRLRLPH